MSMHLGTCLCCSRFQCLLEAGFVGSPLLHLQLHPKSQMGLAGWGDSGKRLFSYPRVTTDAINCEHLCPWKINRDTPPLSLSGPDPRGPYQSLTTGKS